MNIFTHEKRNSYCVALTIVFQMSIFYTLVFLKSSIELNVYIICYHNTFKKYCHFLDLFLFCEKFYHIPMNNICPPWILKFIKALTFGIYSPKTRKILRIVENMSTVIMFPNYICNYNQWFFPYRCYFWKLKKF